MIFSLFFVMSFFMSILDRCFFDFGGVLEGFGRVLGGFLEGFGKVFGGFLGGYFALSLNSSSPALLCLAWPCFAFLYLALPCFTLLCLALPSFALLCLT